MELSGQIDEEAFIEARRLSWAPNYRLNLFNNYVWHRFGFLRLMMIIVAVMIACSVVAERMHLRPALIMVVGISAACLILLIVAIRSEKPSKKQLAKLNEDLPQIIILEEAAFTWILRDGTRTSIPWHNFLRYEFGEHVALLYKKPSEFPFFVPLAGISSDQRMQVEAILLMQIGK